MADEHWDSAGEPAAGGGLGPVRVVVADDCYLVPKALGGLLSTDPGVRVEGLAADYDSVLGLVGEFRPDVVVTDVRMPPSQTDEGIRLAAALRASYPGTGVVVLSQYAESAYAIALVDGGACGRGYLLKERVAELGDNAGAQDLHRYRGSALRSPSGRPPGRARIRPARQRCHRGLGAPASLPSRPGGVPSGGVAGLSCTRRPPLFVGLTRPAEPVRQQG
ncbi:MAG: response regulator transcription factor [Actinomycetota bacterium]|nr:response regulator transcription factor [Actinomycetota bacterium]